MAIGTSPCPPFNNRVGLPPGVLFDGNGLLWVKHNRAAFITIVAGAVSVWTDILGSGRNIIQANAAFRPTWSAANGVLFDGIDDTLGSGVWGVYAQPLIVYMYVRQVTWTFDDYFCDAIALANFVVTQQNITPEIRCFAGVASPVNNQLAVNTWGVVTFLANGVGSVLQVNNNAPWIGNAGNLGITGFTLGSQGGGGGRWSNIEVKELILRNANDNAATRQQIISYLLAVN